MIFIISEGFPKIIREYPVIASGLLFQSIVEYGLPVKRAAWIHHLVLQVALLVYIVAIGVHEGVALDYCLLETGAAVPYGQKVPVGYDLSARLVNPGDNR